MQCKMGRYQVEITLGEGHKSIKGNYIEYPIVKSDFPLIQRTDEGRIYNSIFTTDKDLRAKYMASKYLCAKYYTILLLWVAYAVNTLYNTLLQLLYKKKLAIY